MSWADDEGISGYDYDDLQIYNAPGTWTTRDGTLLLIKDMETSHLINALRLFKDQEDRISNYDELQEELDKRQHGR